MNYQKFGGIPGRNADKLIICCHGGFQKVSGARIAYLDFIKMSGLDKIASENRTIIFPQAPGRYWPLHRSAGVRALQEIIEKENPTQLYIFGFSEGATFIVTQVSRKILCDGVVICSAGIPFLDRFYGPRLNTDSIIMYGSEEWGQGWFHMISGRETSMKIRDMFRPLGDCAFWQFDGGHDWPEDKNWDILDYFGI